MPGVTDTEMSHGFPGPKASPHHIARAIVDGLAMGTETLYPDAMAQQVARGLSEDRESVVAGFSSYM